MRTYKLFDLTEYNSYRIKSFCDTAFFPDGQDDLLNLYKERPKQKKIIIGNGNNIILAREHYVEDFIIFNNCFDKIDVIENEINGEAGATMFMMSKIALKNALTGFEIFYDIPSSVGGAIVMNAGAYDEDIGQHIVQVSYLDLADMKIKKLVRNEIKYGYRTSIFQNDNSKIVLKAKFCLKKDNAERIKNKMEEMKKARWLKQPREFPNCGSVFKRPQGYYVGSIIEKANLKGFTIGGAKISEKHAGFIINYSNATGNDILQLIKYIQIKIRNQYGINLEVEQRIIL